MTVYTFDPLMDSRWAGFIGCHGDASVFHSVPWLEAIQRTYGYKPIVYTTSPPSVPLSNGIVLCPIESWLTGRRLVSLPFSDHCEPLFDSRESACAIFRELKRASDIDRWKYIEVRPQKELSGFEELTKALSCFWHVLDLGPTEEELFSQTHKNGVQAPIKRAVRDGIEYECGTSESLLNAFYRLTIQTRRRHCLPPQPIQWFRNLVACMGERLQIRVAFRHGIEVASILTLRHGNTMVYKYGCSDSRYNNLGATPFLLWNMICEAKQSGIKFIDFGRTDANNPGLITFKNRWGTRSSTLVYVRWYRDPNHVPARQRSSETLKRITSILPDFVLQATGRLLYRHVG